jgi:dTDP-4-dehydrorhamnose reductase
VKRMKILVLGCSGQVGTDLLHSPQWASGTVLTGLARPRFDMTEPDTVRRALSHAEPDVVVNAAAYTAVDDAETDQALAHAVNAEGPALLAEECCRRRMPLIHLSTDYVFDGTSATPYREADPVNPINAYGRSKAAGDEAVRQRHPRHIIVRTSWVYASHGSNFVRTMLRLASERDEVGVVADQFGSPTAAADIADAIAGIVRRFPAGGAQGEGSPWGTYHFTARGETTWHGFAERILAHLQLAGERAPRLRPIAAADYPGRAVRPAYSVLDCSLIERTFGIDRPCWEDRLASVLDRLVPGRAAAAARS